ncbi:MAG: hypothetical protein ABR577_02955 [Pyrinomonadaceae bacterium]
MLTRNKFLTLTLVVALCGLSASALLGWTRHNSERRFSSAAWKEKYKSADELVNRVDAIVLAKAVGAQPGRIAYSENGEDALPFEVVRFEVVNGLKGARAGEQVSVERAGGTDSSGQAVNVDIDGGDFEIGNTYLLFLKHQEDGPYYYQVNDQGRYQVAGRRLLAVDPGEEVSAIFHGKLVQEGLEIVKQKSKAAEKK